MSQWCLFELAVIDEENTQHCLFELTVRWKRLCGADGEMGGFPGGETAGDFGDVGESGALEEAGGDGGAVAAGAVDEDVAIAREIRGFFHQMSERDAFAAVDVFAGAFAGIADVY